MTARQAIEHSDRRVGPQTGEGDELSARLRGMWGSVAQSWGELADYVDARAAEVTAKMLALAAPQPGDRVLELACGPGGVGLAAAQLVGPRGEVILSDIAAEMTAIAAARARSMGLTNVRTCELTLDQIEQPDQSFGVVLCREGLMLALDPAHAVREIRRVLRPGGRVAVAVWGPRARNPWLNILFEVASAQLGAPVPPPGVPSPFSLDDPSRLASLFTACGLADVVVAELSTPLHELSFDAWWTRRAALAGPLATRLSSLPEESQRELRARVQEAVRPYETPNGLEFPGVSLLAFGRRADD